ncbi:3'(2'),5'-bisphosphate nucleotidase CysQ [Ancylobacter pratisalsi]|uniref:3'(2'),5'-bisphosphate nucleotidase CysQ n=1 Tax=Ancylobacter pratisalsi TaxID=1745854 RepID=A0A6P1YP38_9HYPH|nr:3'(2'),5'-bisphosphate nucleotidase CysQ [Ancylobacter pratisalsi]QIB35188.1 3'(2'),5'-bisphosphate nucleotidase CysQ [Ancylobacter pratisalsi]
MASNLGDESLLAEIVQLAVRAGHVVMDVYATDFSAATKADSSPVTEADERAEAIILAGLRRLVPDVPVIAEEECAAGRMPATGSTFFLVDPLDGTKEFLARNGEFTVNIALIEKSAPVMGVVYAPALGVLYAGGPAGAFKARVVGDALADVERIDVRSASPSLKAVGSRSHGSQETMAWLARFSDVSFVSAGSSLKFCLLAEGAADIYPRFGRTMEWDTAAGDAVLRAAGGLVTTCDGHPLTYNKREQADDAPFANPHFLAFGDRRLVETAIAPAASAATL